MENQLELRRKLNFFQKIRKQMYLLGLNRKKTTKYNRLPEYLKNDDEIVKKVIEVNPEMAQYLSKHNVNIIEDIIIINDEDQNLEFLRHVPVELQKKIFYDVSKSRYNLEYFSPDAIVQIALNEERKRKQDKAYKSKLLGGGIKLLPIDVQIKLSLIDNQYFEETSFEAKKKFINGKPIFLEYFTDEEKQQLLKEYPEFLDKMPRSFRNDNYRKNTSGNIEQDKKNYMRNVSATYISTRNDFRERIEESTDPTYLLEMLRFFPDTNTCSLQYYKVIFNCLDQIENGELIRKFIESKKICPEECNLLKLILNEHITSSVTAEELLEYIKKPYSEKLVEIVRKTYGEKSARILKDRPRITLNEIPNLYIFSPNIVEEFGIGAIHANLTFDMNTSPILGELARNPHEMELYKKFNKFSDDMFEDTAIGLENKLNVFYQIKELIATCDLDELTPKQQKQMQIMMHDCISLHKNTEGPSSQMLAGIPISLEELEEYSQKRNEIHDELIQKTTDISQIKELMSNRFFGYTYRRKSSTFMDKLSVSEICALYNLKRFVNDPITLESKNFTEDELDALELLDIFREIEDATILKEIAKALSEREDIINPIIYAELNKKVLQQYSKEIVSSLLTDEQAIEMSKNSEPGIEVLEEDGFKIIKLRGVDFKAYITNPGLNFSRLRFDASETMEKIGEWWREKENGISTISGCLIDQDQISTAGYQKTFKGEMEETYGHRQIYLGFYNIQPEQIIAMGTSDIHVTHERRQLSPLINGSRRIFSYPNEFMTMVSERVENINKDNDNHEHNYAEVVSLRTKKNLYDIKEGEYGGKIIPDYVAIYVKEWEKNASERLNYAKNIAKALGVKEIRIIDVDEYMKRTTRLERAKKGIQEHEPRQQTQFIKEIKTVGDDENGER